MDWSDVPSDVALVTDSLYMPEAWLRSAVLDAARTWRQECAKNKPLTGETSMPSVLGIEDADAMATANPAFLCAAGAEVAIAGAVLAKYDVEPYSGPLRTSILVDVFRA